MKHRKTVAATIATFVIALAALTLLAPSDALARKNAAERLAESTYATLTTEASQPVAARY